MKADRNDAAETITGPDTFDGIAARATATGEADLRKAAQTRRQAAPWPAKVTESA